MISMTASKLIGPYTWGNVSQLPRPVKYKFTFQFIGVDHQFQQSCLPLKISFEHAGKLVIH
jgi:hypothetical protein